MKKEDGFFGNGEKLDEALMEFEFDLSEEDLGGIGEDSSSDEDVIELVDVVEEGDNLEDLESEEIDMALDADEFMEEEIGDEDLESDEEPELSLELDDSDLEGLEAEFDDMTRGPAQEADELEEAPVFDLEALAKVEALKEKTVEGAQTQPEAFTAKGSPIAIPEERVEQIIREVVADVVERVARETMASVAEKVIGEAIDALKQSLESPSE